jgi:short-subunit dehydrogenase
MRLSFKPLREQVIVITGASSGIGLATAKRAAREGSRLVLAARNGDALREVEREIVETGGEAISVAADVGRLEDVKRIAVEAIERFGGFDTWVNDAGLGIWGKLEQVSDEDNRRLFDTNFWGVVYGSLVAADHLRTRGGAIINVGSVASDAVFPLQGMYCASKHAVKGFTDTLRIELEDEGAPISVTLVKPGAIDTPFPQNARNYTEREAKLPTPLYPADEVARAILHSATHEVRDIYVGSRAKITSMLNRYAPRVMDRIARGMKESELGAERPRNPLGALYMPGQDGRIQGDNGPGVRPLSVYSRATRNPVMTTTLVAAGLAAAAYFANSRRSM